MSTTHSAAAVGSARTTGSGPAMNWLREPLLHFLLLGGLLFAADHVIHGHAGNPHLIVVGQDVQREVSEVFKGSRGREPNADELKALLSAWLDNEVLYREGLALQVDKGDTAIRERVIFKALSVVDANVRLPEADDQVVRAWFESHRAKYDEPARYDFEEAVLPGTPTEAEIRALVEKLNFGTPGDTNAVLSVFKGRPYSNLVLSYGDEFPAALGDQPTETWRALPTRDGWRAMRLRSFVPASPASYEALRGVVLQDWKDSEAAEQRTAAVRALTKKYEVQYEAGRP